MEASKIPSVVLPSFSLKAILSSSSSVGPFSVFPKLSCPFLGSARGSQARGNWDQAVVQARAACWFRFGSSGVGAEGAGIYGSRSRDHFDRDDVEQIEGDKPKIEELLRAGADCMVKDADGRTALDRAANDEIKDFITGGVVFLSPELRLQSDRSTPAI